MLHRYAILVSVCTLLLVVAGGLVTSNEAGLSVPDWPLSYGKLMPEMTGGILYEHGHRMVATTVGLLTIGLAVWLWRADGRRWVRRLGLVALGMVVLEGLLGGLTVIYLLPKPVSIAHACLAQLFFSTTTALALFTSPSWQAGPRRVDEVPGFLRLRVMAFEVPAVMLVQVALGAAYRHKALDLIPHVVGGVLVAGATLGASHHVLTHYSNHRVLRRTALALTTLALTQVFLGIGAYMARVATADSPQPSPSMVLCTVAHVAVGALTMAASVLFAIQALRHVRPAGMILEAA